MARSPEPSGRKQKPLDGLRQECSHHSASLLAEKKLQGDRGTHRSITPVGVIREMGVARSRLLIPDMGRDVWSLNMSDEWNQSYPCWLLVD